MHHVPPFPPENPIPLGALYPPPLPAAILEEVPPTPPCPPFAVRPNADEDHPAFPTLFTPLDAQIPPPDPPHPIHTTLTLVTPFGTVQFVEETNTCSHRAEQLLPFHAEPDPHLYWQVFAVGLALYPAVTALSEVPPVALVRE
jgi:hypothetical protein